MANKWPKEYQSVKDALPAWILFYNLAGYDYYPEERISYQIKDISVMNQQSGLDSVKEIGAISAYEMLKAVQQPSAEPYWKLRYKGACEDIFFITINDKLEGLIGLMSDLADSSGYSASDMGIYIQPIVQGTSCHCEFNLFYNPDNKVDTERIKGLAEKTTKTLMYHGAFFSRPYGENAGMILNKDSATVKSLNKFKKVLDPNNVMNPGKICF